MKAVKTFDLFQKVSYDNINQPTLLGGLLSISSITIMLFLLFTEISNYFTPLITKQSIIYQTSNGTIPLSLQIKTPNSPCAIISIDQEDLIGKHNINIQGESIVKTRLSNKGNVLLSKNFSPYQTELLNEAILNGENCVVNAVIEINKVPGDFHISYHEYRTVIDALRRDNSTKNTLKKLKLNHQLLSLTFGNEDINNYIIRKYAMSDVIKGFIQKNVIVFDEEDPDTIYNYDYYLKIIPFIFIDENTNEKVYAYEYSLSSTSHKNEEDNEMPIIMFNYDFSPITMKVTLHHKSLLQFLTHVCAIVGGVFVIFSIANSILVHLFINESNK